MNHLIPKLILLMMLPILFWYISLILHELSHAISAKILGCRVTHIQLSRLVFSTLKGKVSVSYVEDADYFVSFYPRSYEHMPKDKLLKLSLIVFLSGTASSVFLIILIPLVYYLMRGHLANMYLFAAMVGVVSFFLSQFFTKGEEMHLSDIQIAKRIIASESREEIYRFLLIIYAIVEGDYCKIDTDHMNALMESHDVPLRRVVTLIKPMLLPESDSK